MRFLKSGTYIFFAFFLIASFLYMAACSDDDEVFKRETEFNIGITDIPCLETFDQVNVTFSSFLVQELDDQGNPIGEPIELVPDPIQPINVLEYIDGNIFTIPFFLEPGWYEMVSATIDQISVIYAGELDEHVILSNPVSITLQGNVQFEVIEGMETTVVIDFHCDDSMIPSGETFVVEPVLEVVAIIHS